MTLPGKKPVGAKAYWNGCKDGGARWVTRADAEAALAPASDAAWLGGWGRATVLRAAALSVAPISGAGARAILSGCARVATAGAMAGRATIVGGA